ncbi:unnamed protein product [Aphanomyces euteiches]
MVVVVAACGGASDSKESTPPAGKTAETVKPADNKPVTLRMIHWQNEGTNKALNAINAKFHEKYPNITVDYATVKSGPDYDQVQQTRVNANDVDIVTQTGPFVLGPEEYTKGAADPLWKQWIDGGIVADLTDQAFIKNWQPSAIKDAVSYKGKVYGLPSGSVAFTGLYYNKDIFAKYNLDVPTTWTELLNVFKVLKDNKVAPLGFAGKDLWPLNLAIQGLQATIYGDQKAYAKSIWEGTTKFNDAANVEALTKAQILMQNAIDGFTGIDYGALPGLFAGGKFAMVADGTWNAGTIAAANADLKFGYFPLPGSDDASKNKTLFGKYDMSFLVMEKSANKDAALKWMEFYSDPANYGIFVKESGFIPAQDNQDANVSEFTKGLTAYGFANAWDQTFISRQNLGEHIVNTSIHAEFLKPFGSLEPKALADLQAKEWDAAK